MLGAFVGYHNLWLTRSCHMESALHQRGLYLTKINSLQQKTDYHWVPKAQQLARSWSNPSRARHSLRIHTLSQHAHVKAQCHQLALILSHNLQVARGFQMTQNLLKSIRARTRTTCKNSRRLWVVISLSSENWMEQLCQRNAWSGRYKTIIGYYAHVWSLSKESQSGWIYVIFNLLHLKQLYIVERTQCSRTFPKTHILPIVFHLHFYVQAL